MKKYSWITLILWAAAQAYGQTVPFVLSFRTTDYSFVDDANNLAGYVTTPEGEYVNTIGVYAGDAYVYHLTHWRNTSRIWSVEDVDADAYMGATRPSYYSPDPVVFNWDLKDHTGNTVQDGTYVVHLEINNWDGVNKYGTFNFVKDGNAGTRNIADFSQYTDVSVVYSLPSPDADNDGMLDVWELEYGLDTSIDDSGLDPDGDRSSNISEFVAGTNPTNPASAFILNQYKADSDFAFFLLRWNSVSGKVYGVQSSTNLQSEWTFAASNIMATPPFNSWGESYSAESNKYYRLIVQP